MQCSGIFVIRWGHWYCLGLCITINILRKNFISRWPFNILHSGRKYIWNLIGQIWKLCTVPCLEFIYHYLPLCSIAYEFTIFIQIKVCFLNLNACICISCFVISINFITYISRITWPSSKLSIFRIIIIWLIFNSNHISNIFTESNHHYCFSVRRFTARCNLNCVICSF